MAIVKIHLKIISQKSKLHQCSFQNTNHSWTEITYAKVQFQSDIFSSILINIYF